MSNNKVRATSNHDLNEPLIGIEDRTRSTQFQQNQAKRKPSHVTKSKIASSFADAKILLEHKIESRKPSNASRPGKSFARQATDPKRHEYEEKREEAAEQFKGMDSHRIPLEELFERTGTDPTNGLRDDQVGQLLAKYGLNKLAEKKKTPWYLKFLKELTNFFALLLWVASILCIIAYAIDTTDPSNLVLFFVIIFVIFFTAVLTYLQNAKSEAVMEGFKDFIPKTCIVYRNGARSQIVAEQLVPGDIVDLKMGDMIPADVRILACRELKVDNSALTGESEPLLRKTECTHEKNPLETANLAFFGTLAKEGSGKGIVVATGQSTVLGQIADLVTKNSKGKTPLRKELDRFIIMITVIALVLGIGFFAAGFGLGYPITTSLTFGIGIIVANVPEGLLGCITISLAITARRLADRSVLVKDLEAVETLGSTSMICTDKTGTLTMNKMTVEHLWYNGKVHVGKNKLFQEEGEKLEYDPNELGFRTLHECAIINCEAEFQTGETPVSQVMEDKNAFMDCHTSGDATETAFIKFYQPIEDITVTREKNQAAQLPDGEKARLPFNSQNKFSLLICNYPSEKSFFRIYMKGAPERIWGFCNKMLVDGDLVDSSPFDEEFKAVNLKFAKNGERVIGLAYFDLPKEDFPLNFEFSLDKIETFNIPMENYNFCGLISLLDPPKETVPFAVQKCRTANIKVVMITGDQAPTAATIARKINLITFKTYDELMDEGMPEQEAKLKARAVCVHGDLLQTAIDREDDLQIMEWLSKDEVVFARTTPKQKLKIVEIGQTLGYMVGVTGDGVNDSPAIKQADIGISMGITGSDVSKDAADIVLLDDNFASIILGIQEGRKIFDNLKKTIVYLLTSNCTEIFPFVAFMILQFPLPLSSLYMICICVGTDILPAISLAYEEAEMDIMVRKPRPQNDHLVSRKLITHAYLQMGEIASAGGFYAYFVVMNDFGFPPGILFGLSQKKAVLPKDDDVYNPSLANLGNSNLPTSCGPNIKAPDTDIVDWLSNGNGKKDLRMAYTKCENGRFVSEVNFGPCLVGDVSPISNKRICYTTDALKYAQTSYFVGVVLIQWCNILVCRVRFMSTIYAGYKNKITWLGIFVETAICVVICYIPPLNYVFGSRPMRFLHFGLAALPFAILLLVWDEVRKYLIRNQKKEKGELNWFERNSYW